MYTKLLPHNINTLSTQIFNYLHDNYHQCNTNGSSRVPVPLQALLVRDDSLRLPFLYPRLLRRDRRSHVGSVLTLTLCLVADDFVTAFLADFLVLLFIPLRLLVLLLRLRMELLLTELLLR